MRRRTFIEGLLGAVGIGLSGKALAEAAQPEAPDMSDPGMLLDHSADDMRAHIAAHQALLPVQRQVSTLEHGYTYDSGRQTAFSLGTPEDREWRRRFAIKTRIRYGKWCDPASKLGSEGDEPNPHLALARRRYGKFENKVPAYPALGEPPDSEEGE